MAVYTKPSTRTMVRIMPKKDWHKWKLAKKLKGDYLSPCNFCTNSLRRSGWICSSSCIDVWNSLNER